MEEESNERCLALISKLVKDYKEFTWASARTTITKQLYDQLVEHPMWLNNIHEKVKKRQYPDVDAFGFDVRRAAANCLRFNVKMPNKYRAKGVQILQVSMQNGLGRELGRAAVSYPLWVMFIQHMISGFG